MIKSGPHIDDAHILEGRGPHDDQDKKKKKALKSGTLPKGSHHFDGYLAT